MLIALGACSAITDATSGEEDEESVVDIAVSSSQIVLSSSALNGGSTTPSSSSMSTPGTTVVHSIPTAVDLAIRVNTTEHHLIGSFTYRDSDGKQQGESKIKWFRDGILIDSSNTLDSIYRANRVFLYPLTMVDSNATITFEVTPAGVSLPDSSIVVGVMVSTTTMVSSGFSAPTALVTLTGSAQEGDTLVAGYRYRDTENDPEGQSLLQWYRDSVPIVDATELSYRISKADSGSVIWIEVTPVATQGSNLVGAVARSTSMHVKGFNPPIARGVVVNGDIKQNSMLTVGYNFFDPDGDLEAVSPIQWYRDSLAIDGATDSSYTITYADSGRAITVGVTPTAVSGHNAIGYEVRATKKWVTNTYHYPHITLIDVSNNSTQDSTLIGSYTYNDGDGDEEGLSTYRWLRDGVAIDGAVDTAYTITYADSGAVLSFEVTPVALTGHNLIGKSSKSSINAISGYNAPVFHGLDLAGTPHPGDTLTMSYSYYDHDGDAEGVFQYQWLLNNAPIAGADSNTYIVKVSDLTNALSLVAVPVAATGTTVTGLPDTTDQVNAVFMNRRVADSLVDTRDGTTQSYDVVFIGTQIWMAENLRYLPAVNSVTDGSEDYVFDPFYYIDGYTLSTVNGNTEEENGRLESTFTKGVLYNWYAAETACPTGWRIPTESDWDQLGAFISDEKTGLPKNGSAWKGVGYYLKANKGWAYSGWGNDTYKFTGNAASYRDTTKTFVQYSTKAHWWTAEEESLHVGKVQLMSYASQDLYSSVLDKSVGTSVRCLSDDSL